MITGVPLPGFRVRIFRRISIWSDRLRRWPSEKGCKPSQLALAWVLAQGDDIVPIPGTKRRKYLEENAAALDVQLNAEDLRRLTEAFPHGAAAGLRYTEQMMKAVNQ